MARITASRTTSPARVSPTVILVLLRRLRAEAPLVGAVLGVVLITSLVFASIPRLFNVMSDEGLRYTITHAQVYERNIAMSRAAAIEPGPDGAPLAPVVAAGEQFKGGLDPSLQSVIDHQLFIIDALRYRFVQPPGSASPINRYITLRYQEAIDQHITLVDGRLPARTSATVAETAGEPQDIPVIEVAISPETAEQLNVQLEDTVVLEPDPEDRLLRLARTEPGDVAVQIVGLIDLPNIADDYWYADPRFHRASVYDDGNQVKTYATALVAPDAYADIQAATAPAPMTYTYRYYVAPQRFDAGSLAALAAAARRLDAQYGSLFFSDPTTPGVNTQLTQLFNDYGAQHRLTEAILSLAVIGLLTVALTTIGLVAAFIADRRREMIALVRGRGASPRQLLATQAVEALLLSLPAAALGYLLALVLINARPSNQSAYIAIAIIIATTLLMLAMAAPIARRRLGALERPEIARQRPSARRVAIEVFVVAVAALGIYLLRRRGLVGDSTTTEIGGFDPYLAAVPVLLGFATGLVALRLYSLPMRFLAWNASFRSDLVPFLGFRRVARQSAVNSVPLLVLLLSVAVSVFASVMLHTIEAGQVTTSWERVGADYRIDAFGRTSIPERLDLTAIDGVEAQAGAFRTDDARLVATAPIAGRTTFLAIDTGAYQRVAAGTPVDPAFAATLIATQPTRNIGQPGNPVPAIVSHDWATGRSLNRGDSFALEFEWGQITFVATEIRDRFHGLPPGTPFVVAPLTSVQAAGSATSPGINALYVRAPASAADDIEQVIDEQFALGTVVSRAKVYAEVHDSPLIAGAATGFRIGILIAAAYSALAVIVALALTSRSRSRDLAFLRTLGLSSRQVVGLIVAEQAPPVALALVVGTGLGIAAARLVEPGLDFTAFTGPDIPVTLAINWTTVVLLASGLVAAVAVAVALVSVSAQRANLTGVLRLGDE